MIMKAPDGMLCNRCEVEKGRMRDSTRVFDHEELCDSCTIDRLIDAVERLSTMYVTCTAEVRYEKNDN
jgi:hypothetical protein